MYVPIYPPPRSGGGGPCEAWWRELRPIRINPNRRGPLHRPSAGPPPPSSTGEEVLPHSLQLPDHPLDQRQADAPEGRVARVESERLQQLGMVLSAARRQHSEVPFGEALARVLVDAVKRIHQAVAECVGVDIERRMDEMADIGPVRLIAGAELDRWAQTVGLNAHP